MSSALNVRTSQRLTSAPWGVRVTDSEIAAITQLVNLYGLACNRSGGCQTDLILVSVVLTADRRYPGGTHVDGVTFA